MLINTMDVIVKIQCLQNVLEAVHSFIRHFILRKYSEMYQNFFHSFYTFLTAIFKIYFVESFYKILFASIITIQGTSASN